MLVVTIGWTFEIILPIGIKPLFLRADKTSAEVAQLVERQLPKLKVAGSNLVFRS